MRSGVALKKMKNLFQKFQIRCCITFLSPEEPPARRSDPHYMHFSDSQPWRWGVAHVHNIIIHNKQAASCICNIESVPTTNENSLAGIKRKSSFYESLVLRDSARFFFFFSGRFRKELLRSRSCFFFSLFQIGFSWIFSFLNWFSGISFCSLGRGTLNQDYARFSKTDCKILKIHGN